MRIVSFAPAAREELELAARWYEAREEGLGQEFVVCIDVVIRQIATNPLAYAIWEHDERFRHVVAPRFPYVVFYRVVNDGVEVLAIAHGARKPGYWLGRQ